MPSPLYPTNTKVGGIGKDAINNGGNNTTQNSSFAKGVDKIMNPTKYSEFNIEPLDVSRSALGGLASVPGTKRLQSFEELEGLRRKMETLETGKAPIKHTRIKTTKPGAVKQIPLSAEQRKVQETQRAAQARADLIKSNQIDLARNLHRQWVEQGINTPAGKRKAMMRAIEINPATSTPPIEGLTPVPYRTGYRNGQPIMFMGEPLLDGMNATDRTFGPHSRVLQLEKPLKAATNYGETVGLVPRYVGGQYGLYPTETNIQLLSDGLENAAGLLREMGALKKGGVISAKSGIHIKKENRGKFTKSAKAAGEGVQEHAHKVMNNPNATALQRKRANFAIQAAKWAKKRKKHARGGKIMPYGAYNIIHNND